MLLSSFRHFYNLEKSGEYIIQDCGFVDFAEPISFSGEVQLERKEVIRVRFLILTVTIVLNLSKD